MARSVQPITRRLLGRLPFLADAVIQHRHHIVVQLEFRQSLQSTWMNQCFSLTADDQGSLVDTTQQVLRLV